MNVQKDFEAMSKLMSARFRKRSDFYQIVRYFQFYLLLLLMTVAVLVLILNAIY